MLDWMYDEQQKIAPQLDAARVHSCQIPENSLDSYNSLTHMTNGSCALDVRVHIFLDLTCECSKLAAV